LKEEQVTIQGVRRVRKVNEGGNVDEGAR
jgi:hypothetical protein